MKKREVAPAAEKMTYAPKEVVLGLIKGLNEDKTRVQNINGTRGEEIKEYTEHKHLHPRALKDVASLVRMDAKKRNDLLRARAKYYEYAKEAGLFGDEHAGDLVDDAEDDWKRVGSAVALGAVAAETITRLRGGINQVSEEESALSA